jgi:peptidoglycan/LPS O-acetylase OafA/YrhL
MLHGKLKTLFPLITLFIAISLTITGLYFDCDTITTGVSFGLAACIVGGITMVALWPITCRPYSKKRIRILCSCIVIAFVLQLVAVVVGCVGAFSIVAAVLYLISAATVWISLSKRAPN